MWSALSFSPTRLPCRHLFFLLQGLGSFFPSQKAWWPLLLSKGRGIPAGVYSKASTRPLDHKNISLTNSSMAHFLNLNAHKPLLVLSLELEYSLSSWAESTGGVYHGDSLKKTHKSTVPLSAPRHTELPWLAHTGQRDRDRPSCTRDTCASVMRRPQLAPPTNKRYSCIHN